MKKIASLIAGLVLAAVVYAQQDPQYSQFMYNKLGLNPAYAGSGEAACISAIYRTQWIGIDGAPQTMLANFHMPLQNNRVGIGGAIWRNTIGISETLNAEAAYAYRMRLGSGHLALGVMASVRLMRVEFNRTQPVQQGDQSIPGAFRSKYIPNFGVGAYYQTPRFYLGLSLPRVLENSIDFSDEEVTISREVRHFYVMGGVLLDLNENTKLQPQVLLKYVPGAPFDADANLNLIILNRYTVGLSYRIGGSKVNGAGESVDVLLGAQVTNNIMFGLAYDITLSDLRNYNSGTIEAVARYCFGKGASGEEYLNPRFF
jgi:type IX secretion system PorP/SprF family membrane protein